MLSQSNNDLIHNPPKLKTFSSTKASAPDLKCIDASTVADLITGKYSQDYSKVYVIDCRFDYEYEGGHIKGALNLCTSQELEQHFISRPSILGNKICIVFHCEFSSHRGPTLCRQLRGWDRKIHADCYPRLYYPEIYLLQGGYKCFYQHYPSLCVPQAYLPMRDRRFAPQLKLALSTVRKEARSRKCQSARGRSSTRMRERSGSLMPRINGVTSHSSRARFASISSSCIDVSSWRVSFNLDDDDDDDDEEEEEMMDEENKAP